MVGLFWVVVDSGGFILGSGGSILGGGECWWIFFGWWQVMVGHGGWWHGL